MAFKRKLGLLTLLLGMGTSCALEETENNTPSGKIVGRDGGIESVVYDVSPTSSQFKVEGAVEEVEHQVYDAGIESRDAGENPGDTGEISYDAGWDGWTYFPRSDAGTPADGGQTAESQDAGSAADAGTVDNVAQETCNLEDDDGNGLIDDVEGCLKIAGSDNLGIVLTTADGRHQKYRDLNRIGTAVQWSADNQEIYFVFFGQSNNGYGSTIFEVNADLTGDVRQLSSTYDYIRELTLSADGRTLAAFLGNINVAPQILLIPTDGGVENVLPLQGYECVDLNLSRDATLLAYRCGHYPDYSIYVYNLSSGLETIIDTNNNLYAPAWNPSVNEELAYARRSDVRVTNLQTGRFNLIDSEIFYGSTDFLRWSPDGNWIATSSTGYYQRQGPLLNRLTIYRPDGSERHELMASSEFRNYLYGLSWSKDSRKVAFTTPQRGEIYTIDTETLELQELDSSVHWYNPVWNN